MTETKRLALVARVTDKIGSEGKDVKFTFSTVFPYIWLLLLVTIILCNLLCHFLWLLIAH